MKRKLFSFCTLSILYLASFAMFDGKKYCHLYFVTDNIGSFKRCVYVQPVKEKWWNHTYHLYQFYTYGNRRDAEIYAKSLKNKGAELCYFYAGDSDYFKYDNNAWNWWMNVGNNKKQKRLKYIIENSSSFMGWGY